MGATRLAAGIKAKDQQAGVLLVLSVNLYFVSFFPDARRVAPIRASVWCLRLMLENFRMFTSHLTAIKTTFVVLSALCTFYMHCADIQQFKQCRHHLHASALSIHASALLYTHLHFLYTPQKGRNAFCIGGTILQSRQTTMPVTGGRIFGCSYSKAALPIRPQTNAITAFTTQP